MRLSRLHYAIYIVGLFIILLLVYLLIAYFYHAPRGYYGTIDQPRFADPWIARSETILNGGLLHRDVFTSTPPLTNLLLLPPSLIPILVGMVNPWATLSFMVYFSLFNLFTALVLLNTFPSKKAGFWAAALFLLNPLTFGNSVLRRQDESILVFFVALSLFFILKNQHARASIAIGASLLVKLTGGLLIPVAFLNKRDWRYIVIPPLVFFIGLLPFLILAGRDAIFWDFTTSGAQHPFQFKGVSLMTLWNAMNVGSRQISILPVAFLMIVGVLGAAAIIARSRFGIVEDMIILTTAVFLFSPKLHTGYFSVLVLLMAMLIKEWRLAILYFLFGALALVADFYKWPIIDYQAAFWLMVGVLILMVILTIGLHLQSQREDKITNVPVAQV